jgi:hypothetical protein
MPCSKRELMRKDKVATQLRHHWHLPPVLRTHVLLTS